MDDDVEIAGQREGVVQVALDDADPLGYRTFDLGVAHPIAPALEHLLAQQTGQSGRAGGIAAGSNQQADPGVGVRGEELLQGGLTEEAGGAGQQHVAAGQRVRGRPARGRLVSRRH